MIVETIDIEGFYILFAIGSNWKELLPIDFCTKNSEQEIIMSDYAELAQRWGMSKATVCRILKHLREEG